MIKQKALESLEKQQQKKNKETWKRQKKRQTENKGFKHTQV